VLALKMISSAGRIGLAGLNDEVMTTVRELGEAGR
jgi:hypothetical protein